ncbi:MAG TPA: hypothetical protein PK566_06665 [Pseudobacteroides sp.]|nr:hypothetical protein [Pseudobacteroides sp.]
MKLNSKIKIFNQAWIIVLIFIILYFLYNLKIKTFDIFEVTIPMVFSLFIDKNQLNTYYKVIFLISILLFFILSYNFDYIIDENLNKEENENIQTIVEFNTSPKNEEQDELKSDSLPEKNIIQEIMPSVDFITPNQLEKEFLYEDKSYIPNVSEETNKILFILSSLLHEIIPDVNEYYLKAVDIVKVKIDCLLHTKEGYPTSDLNANTELTKILEKANELDALIKDEKTVENYIKLMELYGKAYKLAPCSKISLQLARPYEEIILIYPRNLYEECNRIIEYGAAGIDYFLQTLTYKEKSQSTEGDIIYRIAKIYHYLGDLPYLDIKYRTEMYQISSAYFELSIKLKNDNDEYKAYKPYYAAMVNHKLGVISNENNYFFLQRALDLYQQSLLYNDVKMDMYNYANTYSYEICYKLIDYINKYGQKDNLKSIESYKELAAKYAGRCK